MLFVKADVFFQDGTAHNTRLFRRMETEIPRDFVDLYRKNVVKITPMKTGWLRRSIITQVLGNVGNISWRARYALAQNEGGHSQTHTVRGANQRDGGFGTIVPGTYRYSRYTTAGTGPRFANIAWEATQAQMPAKLREKGFTK